MNTEELFSQLPNTKQEALQLLRDIKAAGLEFHFDDDPCDIVSVRTKQRLFTDPQCEFLDRLVDRLNVLFREDVPADEKHCANAGAWCAADLCGWVEISND